MQAYWWSGVISVRIKWPCQGGGSPQERRDVVGSRQPGFRTMSRWAKQGWMSEISHSGQQSHTWKCKGAVAYEMLNHVVTKIKSIASEKRQRTSKAEIFLQKHWQGRHPGPGHPPPHQPQQDPNQKAHCRLQMLHNTALYVNEERTNSFRIKTGNKPHAKDLHGSLTDGYS